MNRRIFLGCMILTLILGGLQARWISTGGQETQPLDVRIISSSSISSTVIEISFPGIWISDTTIEGETYHILSAPGSGLFGEPGEPSLPAYRANIAIPQGATAQIKIIDNAYQEIEGINVFPTQKPLPEGVHPSYIAMPQEFVKNNAIYTKNTFFPEEYAFIGGPYSMRDYRFVTLTVLPVLFNPATKTIRIYHHIVVEISHPDGEGYYTPGNRGETPAFSPTYKRFLLNYPYIPKTKAKQINKFNGHEYLIITADIFSDAAYKLAKWKQQKGIPTKVTLFSEIDTPADDTLDIANYIQSLFDNANTEPPPLWILLLGDSTTIPPRYHYYDYNLNGISNYSPTDHKYAVDSFDYYRQNGGDTVYADAYIARLPATTVAQAESTVSKVIRYERHPYLAETAWYKKALGIGAYENNRIFDYTVRRVRQILLNDGGYTQVDTLNEQDSETNATRQARIDTLNVGRTFLLFRGHGEFHGWYGGADNNYPMLLDTNYVQTLNNGQKYHLVIAPTCLAGRFDVESQTVMSETYIREPGIDGNMGAAGYFGATNVSWSYYNDSLSIGAFLAVCDSGVYHYQQMCNEGKLYMAETYRDPNSDNVAYTTFMIMNTLGDPELCMWTDIPVIISATHPGTVYINETNVCTVTVSTAKEKAAVEGALVAVVDDSSAVFETALTDANGQAIFSITPTYEDTVWFTVTKRNHAPYEGYSVAIPNPTSVELVTLSLIQHIGGVEIKWRVENDCDPTLWIVERKKERSQDYTVIAEIPARAECKPVVYSTLDHNVEEGTTYWYRVRKETEAKTGATKKITVKKMIAPGLKRITPNPFSNSVNIQYALRKETKTKLTVLDVAGRVVETLIEDIQPAGIHKVTWAPDPLKTAPGIYLIRLETPGYSATNRIVFIK